MQLVELHRVNTQFYADSGFQLEGTAVLEGYQLYGYTFQIVERSFFELFEQQFCVGLYQTVRTYRPCLAFGAEVGVVEVIVAVVEVVLTALMSTGTKARWTFSTSPPFISGWR